MDGWIMAECRRGKSHTAPSEWTWERVPLFSLALKSAAAPEVTGSDVLSVVCDRLAKDKMCYVFVCPLNQCKPQPVLSIYSCMSN